MSIKTKTQCCIQKIALSDVGDDRYETKRERNERERERQKQNDGENGREHVERTCAVTMIMTTTTVMYGRRDDVSKVYVLLRCMESVEAGKKKESGRRQKTRGRREAGRREVEARTNGVMMTGVVYLQGKEERKQKRQRKCTNKCAQIKCAQREREREREYVCERERKRVCVCIRGSSSSKDACVSA
jgi:hypothetical protein